MTQNFHFIVLYNVYTERNNERSSPTLHLHFTSQHYKDIGKNTLLSLVSYSMCT
jgi:hypothetical protein